MPTPRTVAAVAVLFLASLVRAGDVAHVRVEDVPERGFTVVAARWGTGSRFADVTERARALVTDGGLDVAVERAHFGDPFPHFRKSLVVVYAWRGEIRTATAPEHGRLRIPPSPAAEVARTDAERRLRTAQVVADERVAAAVASRSPDAVRRAVRRNRRAARELLRRGPADLRSSDPDAAAAARRWAERTRRIARAVRVTTMDVASSSDWRNLGVETAPGDTVVFEAAGAWRLGRWAGTCDAAGLSGDRYRAHSTVEELPHGCLLVRVGTDLFGAAESRGSVRVDEGGRRVEAKCNDETYRDNTGHLTLRVVVLPAEALERCE